MALRPPTAARAPLRGRTRHATSTAQWGPEHDAALAQGAAAMGVRLDPAQLTQLGRFARLLLKWNRTFNLLGTDDPRAVLDSHLLDSLAVVPALERWLPPDAAPLVDVGAGAGLPGIPIAILQPERTVVLVEPVGKKAAFLRQAAAECRLASVTIRETRLERLTAGEIGAPFIAVARDSTQATAHFISRAVTSLTGFARLCAPLATADSRVMAMKAARVAEEVAELRDALPDVRVVAVEPLAIPGQTVRRNLVVMQLPSRAPAGRVTTTSSS